MHIDLVETAAASSDGKLLVTGSSGGEVVLWQTAPFRPLRQLGRSDHPRDRITGLAFDPDDHRLAVAHHSAGVVEIWDTRTMRHLADLPAFTGRVAALNWRVKGGQLAVLGADRQAHPSDPLDDAAPGLQPYAVRLFREQKMTAQASIGGQEAWSLSEIDGGGRLIAGLTGSAVVLSIPALTQQAQVPVPGECIAAGLSDGELCLVGSDGTVCDAVGERRTLRQMEAPARAALLFEERAYTGTYDALEVRTVRDGRIVSRLIGRPAAITVVGSSIWAIFAKRAVPLSQGRATGVTHQLMASPQ